MYREIEAAGGLVFNSEYKVLLIFRRGKWDLPKGKCEEESVEQTALREVQEETGLLDEYLSIVDPLIETKHIATHKKDKVIKRTDWFLMYYSSDNYESMYPDISEGITEIGWFTLSKATELLSNAPQRIQYIFDFFLDKYARRKSDDYFGFCK